MSPLYLAWYDKHESTVWILVENKADGNLSDAQGFNPVTVTCQKGYVHLVQHLLRNRANINRSDKN